MKSLYIYRIRKYKTSRITGEKIVAPGIGKKLALHFDPDGNAERNTVTPLKPAKRIADNAVVWCYGNSAPPQWLRNDITLINNPLMMKNSIDKLKTLTLLRDNNVPHLEFTNIYDKAKEWQQQGTPVIVRHILNGKQGKGVELVGPTKELPIAPLYTKFYDKTHEFRVFVLNGKCVDLVQKKRMGKQKLKKLGLDKVDELTRNHKKGWVFAHNDIYDFDFIRNLGIKATKAVGLDFTGVDILARIDETTGELIDAVVCEINSSPGMSSPTTFKRVTDAVTEEYLV